MFAANPFLSLSGVVFLITAICCAPAFSQDPGPPPRPESRIHDEGAVFKTGDRFQVAAHIRDRLDSLEAETGCDVLVATVTAATGTSPQLLADQFAATWLDPGRNGAVLVYERAGNQLAISATEPTRDLIADYTFAGIEQSLAGNREDTEPADAISLAAGDLVALFRKYLGENASLAHPSIKADRYLIGAVTICIAGLVAMVAAVHWRQVKAHA